MTSKKWKFRKTLGWKALSWLKPRLLNHRAFESVAWFALWTFGRNKLQTYIHIKVKNYTSLKRGSYRPDCTYETAKITLQNIHTRLMWIVVVSEGEENSMAYILAFDRRMHRSNKWVSRSS